VPLFQINAEYDHPYLNTHPPLPEIETILKRLKSNLIDTSRLFWRWKDGTCIFCEPFKGPNDEDVQKHTFYDDINTNPIIIQLSFTIA